VKDNILGLFSTLAVNFNVATNLHKDPDDFGLCFIIPLGDFKGGELYLKEPNILMCGVPGDLMILNSSAITHGNLPVTQGNRHSLVLFMGAGIVKPYREKKNVDLKFSKLFMKNLATTMSEIYNGAACLEVQHSFEKMEPVKDLDNSEVQEELEEPEEPEKPSHRYDSEDFKDLPKMFQPFFMNI